MVKLEDNVWDEFGESDDHKVPRPDDRQGYQSSIEGDSRRKLHSEVTGIASNAYDSANFGVPGKESQGIKLVTNNATMLEKGTWSHTPDGVFPSCNTDSTKGVPSIASDDTRISSRSFKSGNIESDNCGFGSNDSIMGDGCTVDDNNLYSYTQSDNDLSFFNNEREEKDNGDLLYYGWPDIGNFDDVDKMFTSCDSTFGMQSLSNDEELCWFSSNADERSEDALKSGLKISCQKEGFSKDVSDCNEDLQLDDGHPIHSDSSDFPMNKEHNGCRKEPKQHNQLEGESEDQYQDIQQRKQSAEPDSRSYVQRQLMQLDYSNHSDQISVCLTPSGTKSEKSGCISSLKGSSYASNQLQSLESYQGLSIEVPALSMSEKGENLQGSQGLQSPLSRNLKNLAPTSPMVCGGKMLNPKQARCSENGIDSQNDAGGNIELPAELVTRDNSCTSTMMDDISLEATSFRQFQQVLEKLDVRTKLCLRDSLYRLARSAEQRHNHANSRGVRENVDAGGTLIVEDTNKCTDFMDMETDTNPIDRSIAHLLFHRPSDPSRVPSSSDSPSLRSHELIHESVSSPQQAMAEKQVCQEETVAGGEKER